MFSKILSCGCKVGDDCACEDTKFNAVEAVQDKYFGVWRDVLTRAGAKIPAGKKHGPCPACGGRDRFRFIDKYGRGDFWCNYCGTGGGLKLLSLFWGVSIVDAANRLADEDFSIKPRSVFSTAPKMVKKNAEAEANELMSSYIMSQHPYMIKKGFNEQFPVNGIRINNKYGFNEPGEILLVPFFNESGRLVNVQRIFANSKKLTLENGEVTGTSHYRHGNRAVIFIMEGFSKSLRINSLTGCASVHAYNTAGMVWAGKQQRKLNPSSKIVFLADNDDFVESINDCPGEYWAKRAAKECDGIISVCPVKGDWEDFYLSVGAEKVKLELRKCLKN